MDKPMEIVTKSARETQKLGEKIGNSLKSGSLICLYGDLGSGKTTFMQGLAKGFGVKKRVLSPTFIIMRQYPLTIHHLPSIINLYHIDLYRIKDEKDVESLGLQEIWSDPKNVVAIEWPEKIEKVLPEKRVNIYFEYLGEDERKIRVDGQWPIVNGS
jgi:tRNA threonylcarbamoyladenosine biosynthesis protein TsaE